MKVGDLVKMHGPGRWRDPNHGSSRKTIYLALQVNANSVFVVSMKTGYKMWAKQKALEVISESR